MENQVLDAIRKRRSIVKFDSTPIDEQKINAILEAARWAPSWINRQPWKFIVIKDQATKKKLSEVVPTLFSKSLQEAPLCIAVTVNQEEDPYHFVEAGAIAMQNMALAAESLGLHTSWIGVFDVKNRGDSTENLVKRILGLPKAYRVISILPVGYTSLEIAPSQRKDLDEIVFYDKFGNTKQG
jgi:nitroreductase